MNFDHRATRGLLPSGRQSLHEAVTIVDRTGRVLLRNPAAHELFGDTAIASFDLRDPQDLPLAAGESPIERATRGEVFADSAPLLRRLLGLTGRQPTH